MFFLKILCLNKKFWLSSLGIWGVVWSVAEGALFALQLTKITPSISLGYYILFFLLISLLIGGYINWPLKEQSIKLSDVGVTMRLRFGDFWKQSGEKIIAVTRCFSSTVDDVIIHSKTLHGNFINRNFATNEEAKIRIAAELNDEKETYEAGRTIKVRGAKDTAFLVGLTLLDDKYQASVKLSDYFIALGNMWNYIRNRNGGEEIVCPLLGTGKARLNFNSSAIFYELLKSALIATKNDFITTDLIFIIHPNDIKKGLVDLEEVKSTFKILCETENLKKITIEGSAENI
jgi:hypothetical protein